ncbi:MAG: methyltransferase domain-containing protein [Holosporaceae bacterium]|jgi:predicted SAM-dependent methyltransferase|nr:methyltransferase domain-containing protein [Holosporaceae bacterium]
MKVNLGCGYRPLKGYVNVDCVANEGVDKVIDLDKYPWDFTDNSVDEVYCDNILEHLDFAKSTKELHRILKKGGKAVIKVPYFSNPGAFFADHQHFYNFDSYNKYCKNIHSGMDISEPFFELESRRITFLDEYKS